MKNPQGYTSLDLLTSGAVIFVIVGVIALIVWPQAIKQQRDKQREEGVRDVTELVLELSVRDPEAFEELLVDLEGEGRRQFGESDDCSGSFGVQCADSVISNTCVQPSLALTAVADQAFPHDPNDRLFSDLHTGYYVSFEDDQLTIGACQPEIRSNIEITSQILSE